MRGVGSFLNGALIPVRVGVGLAVPVRHGCVDFGCEICWPLSTSLSSIDLVLKKASQCAPISPSVRREAVVSYL